MLDDTPIVTNPPVTAVRDSAEIPLVVTEFVDEPEWITTLPAKPGPGLPEAIGWLFGVVFAHLISGLIPLVIIMILMVAQGSQIERALEIEQLPPNYLLAFLGGDQWLFLLLVMFAVRLRWGAATTSRLNVARFHPLHLILVLGIVLPLSTIAGEVYRLANLVWKPFVESLPALKGLDHANAVELLLSTANVGSLPLMLMIIAVAPALSEELVFRGMIGRGLVARWGVIGGVLMSSMMFAAVHLHPVHVIAVLPIGIALHFVYLTTRSFWAPVLLHFLNNAWATVASRTLITRPEAAFEEPTSMGLLAVSIIAIAALGTVMYRTRTRYLLPDDTEWSPGYVTAEAPPADLQTRAVIGVDSTRNLLFAATAAVSFMAVFIVEMVAMAK